MSVGRISDLPQLKALPIAKVAADLGVKLPPNGRGRCPLPGHEDRTPSFALRFTTNSFRCFACARSGSVIDLVMWIEGKEFADACRWLRARYLGAVPGGAVAAKRRSHVRQAPLGRHATASVIAEQADPEVFGWLLDIAPLASSGRAYLNGRAIGDATLAHFRVGQVGDRQALYHAGVRRFGEARLQRCGLIKVQRWGPQLVFPSGYLLFPFLTAGIVSYLQARRADNGTDFRWACPVGVVPPVFNMDALDPQVSTVLICEGITDVLSAHELGRAAIGVLGTSARIDDKVLARLKQYNVVVLGDADVPGQAFSAKLVALLARRGITAVTRPLPAGCNDINDYLRAQRSIAA
jgi:DNA primase